MTNKSFIAKFYGNMDWFDVDDDLEGLNLPEAFIQAKCLWSERSEKNADQILKLIQPYVRAWFVPAAISDSEDLFPDLSDVNATKINVIGVDFSSGPFPLCKAEAWFNVSVTEIFTKTDLEVRQNDTGEYFHQAISFGWEIPSLSGGEPYVFTYGNHLGVEGIYLEQS
jgi:hypothetical protein